MCEQFTSLDVSNIEGFLSLSDFLTEHVFSEEKSISSWDLHDFRETEPSSVRFENRTLTDYEILLKLCVLDCIVDSEPFSDRISNHVTTYGHFIVGWSDVKWLRSSSCFIDRHQRWINSNDDWVDKLVDLNCNTICHLWTELSCKGVIHYFPAGCSGFDVQIQVCPCPVVTHEVDWRIVR